MKILAISDLHGKKFEFPVQKPDLVLFLGDIPYNEIDRIDKMYDCPKFGVLGNHDKPDTYKGTSVVELHKKVIEIDGIKIGGFNGCPRYNEREFGQYSHREVEAYMRELDYVDVFIAHSNPKGIIHNRFDRAHSGFEAYDDYIKSKKPAYFLHGHLHIQQQQLIKDTKVYSVYPYFEFEVKK